MNLRLNAANDLVEKLRSELPTVQTTVGVAVSDTKTEAILDALHEIIEDLEDLHVQLNIP